MTTINDGGEMRGYYGIPEMEALLQRLGIELHRVLGYSIQFSYNDADIPTVEVWLHDAPSRRVEIPHATTVPELEARVKKLEDKLKKLEDKLDEVIGCNNLFHS